MFHNNICIEPKNIKSIKLQVELGLAGIVGANLFGIAIKATNKPLYLDMNNNFIPKENFKEIGYFMKKAKQPLTIDFWSSNICHIGLSYILVGAKYVKNKLNLYLGGNSIGDKGARLISKAIKSINHTLVLDLRCNNIGVKGATFLAESIKELKQEIVIDLRYNDIGLSVIELIYKVVSNSNYLVTMFVDLSIKNNGPLDHKISNVSELKEKRSRIIKSMELFPNFVIQLLADYAADKEIHNIYK